MDLVAALVALGVMGLIPAFIARSKGRSFGHWWLFGTLLLIPATVMALLIKKGDARPIWGRWGLASNPRRALPNIAIFGAIQTLAVMSNKTPLKVAGVLAGFGVLRVILEHFAVRRWPSTETQSESVRQS